METSLSKACVTACDREFIPGAVALLRSIRRNHPEVRCYCFAAVDAEAEVKRALGDLATVLTPPRVVRGIAEAQQLKAVRVFASVLPEALVVWIDADAIMCRPAPELWEIPVGRVNAVQDNATQLGDMLPQANRAAFFGRFPEFKGVVGFNSGVFALRPTDWRDLPERFEQVALELDSFAKQRRLVDQPILNAVMLSRVNWLPRAFNVHGLFDHPTPADVRIIHFTSNPKPWMAEFPRHERAYYYWVRYGLAEERSWPLLQTLLRIWARTPRRHLGSIIKRLARQQPAE